MRGFDPEKVFFEKPVIDIDWECPPTEQAIKDSLSEVIQQIAEERVRQDREDNTKAGKKCSTKGKSGE